MRRRASDIRTCRRRWLVAAALGLWTQPMAAIGAEPPDAGAAAPTSDRVVQQAKTVGEAVRETGERARARLEPLPEGATRIMKAVVMDVQGRAQWRKDEQSPWKAARVDDVLAPGASIRTGRRSALALRVGQNASILVARNSRLELPEIVQVGGTLRTRVAVRRGRADFKVDRVGLTNDFSVMTPSTTLAVKGTGFGLEYGGFRGTEISSSRFNEIAAIEIRYFLPKLSRLLSGGDLSSDVHPDPLEAEMFLTVGPPRPVSLFIEDPDSPELIEDAIVRNPVFYEQRISGQLTSVAATEVAATVLAESNDPDYVFPPVGDLDPGQTAGFICDYLFAVMLIYDQHLAADFGNSGLPGGSGGPGGPGGIFQFPGLVELAGEIGGICDTAGEIYTEETLMEIVDQITAFCEGHFQAPQDIAICVDDFGQAVVTTYEVQNGAQ